jgi:Fe-S-cluster-containing dehydrogenase component
MKSDQEFYSVLIKEAMEDKAPNEMEQKFSGQVDAYQLDCLLYPKKHAPVWHFGSCECLEENPPCAAACIFRAISKDKSGKISIDKALCCGCSACIDC